MARMDAPPGRPWPDGHGLVHGSGVCWCGTAVWRCPAMEAWAETAPWPAPTTGEDR